MIWMVIWLIMGCICHSAASYHFYYMEQWTTFYYEGDLAWQTLCKPGGITVLVAEFLQQFFCYGLGPVIFGGLMTLVAWGQSQLVKGAPRYLGCVTAVAMLLTLTSSNGSLLSGSVTFVCAMLLVAMVCRAHKILKCLAIVLLLCVVRKDNLVREGNEETALIYLPWATAAVVFLLQIFLRQLKFYKAQFGTATASQLTRKRMALDLGLQLIVVVGASAALFATSYSAKDQYMEKIYYYVRHQQWDEIISRSHSRGSKGNVTFQLCRNMALAEKGELGEKFLMYEQSGMNSIMTTDMNSLQVTMLLTDVFYAMGYVNMSQLCAFESQECIDNKSPYLWQRLVDTNLENGAYAVAEKYIQKLERTLAYRDWARERRKFLYNDAAVRRDPVLGLKRKCIFKGDCLMGRDGFDHDLERIVEACPEHRASLEYLGAMYIVSNQQGKFLRLMKKYKGTKAMPRIPASFEKAMKTFEYQATESIEPIL